MSHELGPWCFMQHLTDGERDPIPHRHQIPPAPEPAPRRTCTHCGGLGAIETSERVGSGDWAHWVPVNQTCPLCGGSGEER